MQDPIGESTRVVLTRLKQVWASQLVCPQLKKLRQHHRYSVGQVEAGLAAPCATPTCTSLKLCVRAPGSQTC